MNSRSRPDGAVHLSGRTGWLRASVLGANDAIVSTASLLIGVAASSASKRAIFVSGIAGLVAGATSMGAGEYVSVSSQRDAEEADIERERQELTEYPDAELQELAAIYVHRGLEEGLALKVAEQLSAHDRLGSHVSDEIGISDLARARPFQAAWASASSFAIFAFVPIGAFLLASSAWRIPSIAGTSLASLAVLGALGGHLGGAPLGRAALRVTLGGAMAMTASELVGRILGVSAQ